MPSCGCKKDTFRIAMHQKSPPMLRTPSLTMETHVTRNASYLRSLSGTIKCRRIRNLSTSTDFQSCHSPVPRSQPFFLCRVDPLCAAPTLNQTQTRSLQLPPSNLCASSRPSILTALASQSYRRRSSTAHPARYPTARLMEYDGAVFMRSIKMSRKVARMGGKGRV